jgi:plastocyanin
MARRRLAFISGASVSLALLLGALSAGVAAGGMGCHSGIERDAEESLVVLTGSCMNPLVARVPTGGVVTFTNGDKIAHAITGAANTWGTYDDLLGGESVAYRFTADGIYPYFCYIHPGMIGAIVVGDSGPGGTGASVERVSLSEARNTVSQATTPAPTAAPTAQPTASPTPEPSASAAAVAPASTTPTSGGSPTGANSILILGLLAVLLGAGAAYGFGLVPGLSRPRTRTR